MTPLIIREVEPIKYSRRLLTVLFTVFSFEGSMVRLFLSLLSLVIVLPLYGQQKEINIGHKVDEYVLFYQGIVFEPLTIASNKPSSVLCKEHEKRFYVNGLELEEEQFAKLDLLLIDLSNYRLTDLNGRSTKGSRGVYEYEFKEDCVDRIIYRVTVKLPIFLNRKEVSMDNQEATLRKVLPDEIVSIKRRRSLFGRGEIHIQTKSIP